MLINMKNKNAQKNEEKRMKERLLTNEKGRLKERIQRK